MSSISKKVCLLGDFAVGKTSLVRRFVYNRFDDKYVSTIGVKVSRKVVAVPIRDQVTELVMMLWDLAGSEEFDSVRQSYLRGTSGAVVVCDLTRPDTLESLRTYARDLRSVSPNAKLVIAANKKDVADNCCITEEQLEGIAVELGGPYYLTSAKVGDEVEAVFRCLGKLVLA